jgi:hypothetical protein
MPRPALMLSDPGGGARRSSAPEFARPRMAMHKVCDLGLKVEQNVPSRRRDDRQCSMAMRPEHAAYGPGPSPSGTA